MKFAHIPNNKKYSVLVIDPPWQYQDKGKSGKRGASQHYKTLSFLQLLKLPINKISKRNSLLFLWFTDTHMIEASLLSMAWGFQPVRIGFVWIKVTKDFEKQRIMLGRYTRSNAEFVLIGKKGGGIKRKNNAIRQVIFSIPGKHSQKPNDVNERIDKLYPRIKKIEMFARNKTKKSNWDYWGDQV